MKLAALRLHNVRRFAGRGVAIEGIGDGVNVLCAANEYGKSTCFDALHALFFQPHSGTPGAVQALRPYSGGSPLIEVDVETAEGRRRITKQFYGGRKAVVTDLETGRLIAQADEAERLIAGLVSGHAGEPAGLLWVRQGVTGLEKRPKADEESERRAREGVLISVQGEVEALTGGRRMAEILAACQEELARFVTTTGRPKTGGDYAKAIAEREQGAEREQRLRAEVERLREALDARRGKSLRLKELEDPAETERRRLALAETEAAFLAAKAHGDALKAAEATAELARSRWKTAAGELAAYRALLAGATDLHARRIAALASRDAALERQRASRAAQEARIGAREAAERAEKEARDGLARIEQALRAREANARLAALRETLRQAEIVRQAAEAGDAAARALAVPEAKVQELEAIETELAGLRATVAARSPSVRMHYLAAGGSVSLDGAPLGEGEDRVLPDRAEIAIAGIGTLSFRSPQRDAATERLAAAEVEHQRRLGALGVAGLAEARQRMREAEARKAEAESARTTLVVIAPKGLAALREEIVRLEAQAVEAADVEGDPEAARQRLAAAGQRVDETRNAVREAQPALEQADRGAGEAEQALAAIAQRLAEAELQLGEAAARGAREAVLAQQAATEEAALAAADEAVRQLRASTLELAAAEAALKRARSILEASAGEARRLREELADLNGQIRTRSEDAVEEAWREAVEALAAAEAREIRFEREIKALTRLRDALEAARVEARDHYFEPVMRELRPLLGLLFDDARVVFDDETLMPLTVQRNGQIEEVDRLSGGMREQLAVLTRLAFARLLARGGRPAPIILDDALVYSDDDRIEKMFDALHLQSRDQQILVFSCRQRAFANLGGNRLHLADWAGPA